jgi:hypothetical protein
MKKRNYFICFALGVAFAVSLTNINMAIANYFLFTVPMVLLGLIYLIAIGIDSLK